jgi:hypothetical protein
MRRALVVALLLVACVLAGTARADGDPASDYLYGLKVFLPFDVKVPKERQREFVSFVETANRSGYAIRVAVIGSSYDLGSVTSLWRQPRTYARFLGAELQFVYAKRLLIVMPNGFGIYRAGHPVEREYRVLATIPIGKGAVGLVDAAEAAVRKLATSSGVTLNASKRDTKSNGHRDALIVLAAVAILALAELLRNALRRRRTKRS